MSKDKKSSKKHRTIETSSSLQSQPTWDDLNAIALTKARQCHPMVHSQADEPGSQFMLNAGVVRAVLILSTVLLFEKSMCEAGDVPTPKPNILLIIADDMGYSDISCFGGEIQTPHIDSLAKSGIRATNFYVGPTCSPTRSMLLSGCDHHVAGFGNMDELAGPKQRGKPGYEGYLNDRVVPVAKVLREAGYHTYWAGKSHMGYEPSQWPAAMGFERDFTLLQGGGSNWSDMTYPNPAHPKLTFTLNGKPLAKLPDNHFSSEAYTDFIIKSNEEHKADGKPFFAYLSFQTVHSPCAAPDDWLDKYKGVYDKGYDAIRAERLERMKELGIVSKDTVISPRLPMIPAWDDLTPEQKKLSARRMLTVPHKSTSANLAYLCWVWRDGETRCFFGVTFLVDGRVADSNDVIDHARIA